jgi:hypothetical protein
MIISKEQGKNIISLDDDELFNLVSCLEDIKIYKTEETWWSCTKLLPVLIKSLEELC